mmetsp:Transcript_28310/g.79556  ORF Transcript_28310/g.79556 Transcript_28310/m.79556 type:complete len:377 (-) Transcript_28310:644-1774(-)
MAGALPDNAREVHFLAVEGGGQQQVPHQQAHVPHLQLPGDVPASQRRAQRGGIVRTAVLGPCVVFGQLVRHRLSHHVHMAGSLLHPLILGGQFHLQHPCRSHAPTHGTRRALQVLLRCRCHRLSQHPHGLLLGRDVRRDAMVLGANCAAGVVPEAPQRLSSTRGVAVQRPHGTGRSDSHDCRPVGGARDVRFGLVARSVRNAGVQVAGQFTIPSQDGVHRRKVPTRSIAVGFRTRHDDVLRPVRRGCHQMFVLTKAAWMVTIWTELQPAGAIRSCRLLSFGRTDHDDGRRCHLRRPLLGGPDIRRDVGQNGWTRIASMGVSHVHGGGAKSHHHPDLVRRVLHRRLCRSERLHEHAAPYDVPQRVLRWRVRFVSHRS